MSSRAGASEPSRRPRPDVVLAATPGGHLDLLMAAREAFDGYSRLWVVTASYSAATLKAQGEWVRLIPRFHKLKARNLPAAALAGAPALIDRPKLVVTAGSGCMAPYALAARTMGARLVFVETMARIHNASDAGRLLSRIASDVVVQWPELLSVYPGATVCRPALLEHVGDKVSDHPGHGTFVAVGTHIDRFDRLLREVDDAVEHGVLGPRVVAQSGVCTYVPRNYETRPWMTSAELDAAVADASHVICHAGSGLISRTLRAGKIPIIVPRQARYREHVDDHQVQIAERLSAYGMAVRVDGPLTIEHLREADVGPQEYAALDRYPRVAELLRGLAMETLGRPTPR